MEKKRILIILAGCVTAGAVAIGGLALVISQVSKLSDEMLAQAETTEATIEATEETTEPTTVPTTEPETTAPTEEPTEATTAAAANQTGTAGTAQTGTTQTGTTGGTTGTTGSSTGLEVVDSGSGESVDFSEIVSGDTGATESTTPTETTPTETTPTESASDLTVETEPSGGTVWGPWF